MTATFESFRLFLSGGWLSRHAEAIGFRLLALFYLVPVWTFPYLPTQDGPSHLANALILKDYETSTVGCKAIFELRGEPLPNLTSHLLLGVLLHLVSPLVAEKILVSLYILGFAESFRYFLGAFGPRCRPLSWAGLLLVYNRCFWMGFYNYCLSLILLWIIVGYCLRRTGALGAAQTIVLMLLFTAQYFTHLAGFLLALAGALGASVLGSPRRILTPVLIVLASLPACCLAMAYFEDTGFFRAPSAMRIVYQPLARLGGGKTDTDFVKDLAALDEELLARRAGSTIPFSLILLGYGGLLAALTAAGRRQSDSEDRSGPGWLFPAVFGLLMFVAYLLAPNDLGLDHGSFLKTRLALLPPLVWLGCLTEPAGRAPRGLVRGLTVLLLAGNLLLVADVFRAGNIVVKQYTAGLEAVGTGRRLFVVQTDPHPVPLVNPLLHAANYYCLGTGNLNLDNYEASTPHFPVKYRRGMPRGRNNWLGYSRKDVVDVVLCWRTSPAGRVAGLDDWEELFRQGPLRIYTRRGPGGR